MTEEKNKLINHVKQTQNAKRRCITCNLPEIDVINEALRINEGLGAVKIAEWLVEQCDYDKGSVNLASISYHKGQNHHLKGGND